MPSLMKDIILIRKIIMLDKLIIAISINSIKIDNRY